MGGDEAYFRLNDDKVLGYAASQAMREHLQRIQSLPYRFFFSQAGLDWLIYPCLAYLFLALTGLCVPISLPRTPLPAPCRGTSLIRNNLLTQGHDRALGIGLL